MDEHERVRDLAADYVLGVLEPSERQGVDEHLVGCLDCRHALGEWRVLPDVLMRSVPPVPAPPELKARILVAATARPQAVVSRREWGRWAAGLAAAAVVAAVGVDDAHRRSDLAAARTDLAEVERQLTLQRAVAQPVLDGQQFVRLAPVSGAGPSAIWVNPAGKAPYLAAPNLPDLQSDRIYELWFLQGATPVPAGTFRSGAVLAVATLPKGTTALAITVEPQGGSATPTTSPIMVGKV